VVNTRMDSTQEWTSWSGYATSSRQKATTCWVRWSVASRKGLMSAEADVVCGAPWGQQSPDRVSPERVSDTKMGYPGGIDRVADT